MSYTVDYSGLSPEEKHVAALEDCEWYLGAETYQKVADALRSTPRETNETMLRFQLSMIGIQWAAATAMMDEHWGKDL